MEILVSSFENCLSDENSCMDFTFCIIRWPCPTVTPDWCYIYKE